MVNNPFLAALDRSFAELTVAVGLLERSGGHTATCLSDAHGPVSSAEMWSLTSGFVTSS